MLKFCYYLNKQDSNSMSDITAFTLKTWYSPAFDFTSLARFGRGDGGEGVTNNLGESCSNKDLKNLILAKFSELDKKWKSA
ncbi:MAG: hypothetical protein CV045_09505 [Cyanobacteria bacterium M5B4]|nr:MAG: hypothetical protein CV045_09505 [Cyanobacteria bacterium M5B4]